MRWLAARQLIYNSSVKVFSDYCLNYIITVAIIVLFDNRQLLCQSKGQQCTSILGLKWNFGYMGYKYVQFQQEEVEVDLSQQREEVGFYDQVVVDVTVELAHHNTISIRGRRRSSFCMVTLFVYGSHNIRLPTCMQIIGYKVHKENVWITLLRDSKTNYIHIHIHTYHKCRKISFRGHWYSHRTRLVLFT